MVDKNRVTGAPDKTKGSIREAMSKLPATAS